MSSESQGLDPYETVLADLKAKRDQLDQAIQAIENIRSGAPAASRKVGGGVVNAVGAADASEGPGAYLGLTIPDAAKKVLSSRRKAMGNADILAALKAGGLHLTSVDPLNTIGSVLMRRFNTVGDIVRVSRGVWGLQEWYPNRSFKKKPGKGEAEKEGDQNPFE